MSKRICEVFKSPKRDGMYLYVDRSQGLSQVPDAMLSSFGKPESVMVLAIDAQKKLARAKASDVLRDIAERGFYLQMPPTNLPEPTISSHSAQDADTAAKLARLGSSYAD